MHVRGPEKLSNGETQMEDAGSECDTQALCHDRVLNTSGTHEGMHTGGENILEQGRKLRGETIHSGQRHAQQQARLALGGEVENVP